MLSCPIVLDARSCSGTTRGTVSKVMKLITLNHAHRSAWRLYKDQDEMENLNGSIIKFLFVYFVVECITQNFSRLMTENSKQSSMDQIIQ